MLLKVADKTFEPKTYNATAPKPQRNTHTHTHTQTQTHTRTETDAETEREGERERKRERERERERDVIDHCQLKITNIAGIKINIRAPTALPLIQQGHTHSSCSNFKMAGILVAEGGRALIRGSTVDKKHTQYMYMLKA